MSAMRKRPTGAPSASSTTSSAQSAPQSKPRTSSLSGFGGSRPAIPDGAYAGPAEKTLPVVLTLHAIFSAVSAALLMADLHGLPTGRRIAALVAAYVVGVVLLAVVAGFRMWLEILAFVLPLSVFMLVPDMFLSTVLKVLVFADDGSVPVWYGVPVYMAGMWTTPLFLVVFMGNYLRERRHSTFMCAFAAGLVALVVFGVAEEVLWVVPIWHCVGVRTVSHVALYIIVPETLLGVAAYLSYRAVARRGLFAKIFMAFFVMLQYLGAAAAFYMFMEL